MKDVVIIGAGVIGCAVARELSKFQCDVCVLEASEDVCAGTSKANSGIVHAGFDAMPGSAKARFNVMGSRMMPQITQDLDVPFKRNGALVVCVDRSLRPGLDELLERGRINGVQNLRILERDELKKLEPNISDNAIAALYAPDSGIICPFKLTIAMAENAFTNGVDFGFNSPVQSIRRNDDGSYTVQTASEQITARSVINAAGVHSAEFHNQVSAQKIHITPRRGEYCLLDKNAGNHVHCTIFPQPTKMGKGILVTPTIHGNLLIGPTAEDIQDAENTSTTREGLERVTSGSGSCVSNIPLRQIITSFSGLRAHEDGSDFIIGEPEDAPNFIDCAGVESPGLSAAPAIGKHVADLLSEKFSLVPKSSWIATRKDIAATADLTPEEHNQLIKQNLAYGTIICRCESITEGEILDAIHRPLGARSLDGVKRRTRAGMGRCQSGFCMHRVMEILHRELGIPMEEITKSGGKSTIVIGNMQKRQ
ncbi:MAG: NAD(P)/FAD-dependent oxidoreductase [Proteobacteria bacterium]|nr:NAD(P)/FAD-dependent oxidoreductase [Pseudomonadota bacterium]